MPQKKNTEKLEAEVQAIETQAQEMLKAEQGPESAPEPPAATAAPEADPIPPRGEEAPAPRVEVTVPQMEISEKYENEQRYMLDRISSLKSWNGFLSFLCFMLMIAVAGCIWYTYTRVQSALGELPGIEQRYRDSTTQLAEARNNIDRLIANNQALGQQSQALINSTEAIGKNLDQLGSGQAALKQGLQTLSGRMDKFEARHPDDWLLAQAFFMVNNAYQLAILGQDTRSAEWCLTNADELLKAVTVVSTEDIRKALKNDLLTLAGVNQIDMVGLSFKIDSVIDNLNKMNLKGFSDPDRRAAAFHKGEGASSDIADWKENLVKSAQDFSSRFVEVRRRDADAATEFLSPDQRIYLIENIQTYLTAAKYGLLRADQTLYAHNLEAAANLIRIYYDEGNQVYQANMKALGELKAEKISAVMPTTLTSIPAFRTLARERLGVDVPAGKE